MPLFMKGAKKRYDKFDAMLEEAETGKRRKKPAKKTAKTTAKKPAGKAAKTKTVTKRYKKK